jgi:hypothetical protein
MYTYTGLAFGLLAASHSARLRTRQSRGRYSPVYMLYWYKSTNSDAGPAPAAGSSARAACEGGGGGGIQLAWQRAAAAAEAEREERIG